MRNQNPKGDNPHDDESTDDDQPDECGCGFGFPCFRHFESDGGPTAHTDGGETDEITLGERFRLKGEPCKVEVATFAHDDAVVLETIHAAEVREYVVPITVIEETDVAVPV